MRGWRRDLRSLTVDSGERETGMDLPLNLMFSVMVIPVLASITPPLVPLVSISVSNEGERNSLYLFLRKK